MVVVATHDERIVPLADSVVELGGSRGTRHACGPHARKLSAQIAIPHLL